MLDWVVLVVYLILLVRTVPILIRANGTRPGIIFALTVLALNGAGVVRGILVDSERSPFYPCIRLATALVILAYVEWASRNHAAHTRIYTTKGDN